MGLGIEPPLDGGPGGFTYSMVKSGPDVNPDEVEIAHVSAVEVMILWDSNVLHVSHLTPPRSFYVGEEFSEKSGCDYFIPSETLGTTRAPIVVSRGVGAALVILPRSRGYVDIPGQGKISLADLVSTGRARPSSEMSGGYEYELPPNAKARMELEGSALVFQVSAVNAGKKVPVGFLATMEPAAFLFTGLSFLLHMGLVAVFAFFMPSMSGDDSEDLDRDQILMMQKLLNAAAEREQEERQEETQEVYRRPEGRRHRHASQGRRGFHGEPEHQGQRPQVRRPGSEGQPGPAPREAGRPPGGRAVRHDRAHLDDGRRRPQRADGAVGT